ncbi:hypothetical protein [Ralstonia sp. Ralssp135]|uniref:hypothetical protein n=1 Tax=Ralstonia sp. Ralssp135 TaxID=3243016 RepID=UPI0039AFDC72
MVLCDAEFLRAKTPFRIVKNHGHLSATSQGHKKRRRRGVQDGDWARDSGRPLYFRQDIPLQKIGRLALQGCSYKQIDRIDETGPKLARQRVRDAVDLRAQPHGREGPAGTRVDVRATEEILGCEGARLVVA